MLAPPKENLLFSLLWSLGVICSWPEQRQMEFDGVAGKDIMTARLRKRHFFPACAPRTVRQFTWQSAMLWSLGVICSWPEQRKMEFDGVAGKDNMTARLRKRHFFPACAPRTVRQFTWQSAKRTKCQRPPTDRSSCASTHTVHSGFSTANEDFLPGNSGSIESVLWRNAKCGQ